MAASDLISALSTLDSQIATLAAKAADPRSYTIEGLTVARQRLTELIAARKSLAAAIAEDGSQIYEVHSRFII